MRIIAGSHKGRKLTAPKNNARPTLDRAKETLFNILQFSIAGRDVLDVFAGSGALGLEAVSRGANSAVFVDSDQKSVEAIEKNCKLIGCRADVIKGNFVQALSRLKPRKFSLVFVDPPYENEDYCQTCLGTLCANELLTTDAIVACEHKRGTELPDKIACLAKFKERAVGIATFSFYEMGEKL